MTDAELDLAEALFRNPPSASGHHDIGLRLVEEIRRLRGSSVKAVFAKQTEEIVAEHLAIGKSLPLSVIIPDPPESVPTPPAAPKARAKKESK